MAIIDDKVVAMSFESSKFESGVNDAIKALEKLKGSLKLDNAGKGLADVSTAAKKIDLSHIGRGVESISQKLEAFHVAAVAIFASVALKAAHAGASMIKSLSLDPIIAGYKEYSVNLNSIQTILANTEASGATLKDVNAALLELNKYSDKTIYNFAQMARNIGTFTAAGVELGTATGAIKGIANLAALSGSNADQASTAMYQLSQAISAGKVGLMDWNSVVNAGMGGTVFQRALAQTAEAMGTIKKGAVELKGPMKNVTIAGQSFRNSLSMKGPKGDNWLTSDVLTSTLKQFTGDLKDSELAAQGFNAAQIKAIQQTAKTAMHAATEVKTLSQVLDVAKETAGSGWAQTWQIIFGNFTEAKTTFTALSNTINGFINKNAEARNKVLADWKALGGRTVLISAISTAFHNLGMIIKPIKDAFRDIFPAKTGKDLFDLTMRFEEFARALKPSPKTIANLRLTFQGLFAILDIGKQIVAGIFTVFGKLFGAVGDGSGSFLEITGNIGQFLVAIDEALKKGNRLHNFFVGLGEVLAKPVELLSKFAAALAGLFSGFSAGGISGQMSAMGKAMTPLQAIVEGLSNAWNNLVKSFQDAVDMQAVIEALAAGIAGIGKAIGDAASNMNFEAILAVIRTGLFAGLVLMFKQFLGRGSFLEQISTGFGKGILGNISGIFDGLNGSMKAMQQNIKAKTLKEIAIAIALLAASLFLISLIDPKKLNSSLGAMTIMFGELIGAMALLDKVATSGGFLKLPIIVASLIGLAVAIDLLTLSVLALSRLSWDELLRGLAGVGALLAGISVAVKPLSAGSAGLIRAGAGITVLAVGLRILASAVAAFAVLSWEEMTRGLAGVGAGLVIIAGAMKLMPTGSMILTGAGLIAVATGLKILAGAVLQFSAMDWRTMGRGLAGIAGALVAIAVGMRLMPKSLPLTGAGLILVALSLGKISDAVVKMGGMSVKEIAKGIGTLAGSLLVLAVALQAMSGTLAGAAALAVAAVGIAMLVPPLVMLGKQKISTIIKSMIALAAALAIMGIAGAAMTPAVPALLGLGAALFLIGGGLALAGAGLFLIAAGISALAIAGPTGIGIMVAALKEFYTTIPELAKNLVLGLLAIVQGLAKAAPQFVDAIVKIINMLLDAIIKSSPKMAEAFIALLDAGLKVLSERQNEIIAAGIALLIALLQGIKQNIAQVVTTVADIVVTFLATLAKNLGRIVTAGANLLVSFLRGIADNVGKVVTAALDIVAKFIQAIVGGYGKILTAGIGILAKLITGIATNLKDLVTAGAHAVIKFIEGITAAGIDIIKAGVKAAGKFVNAIADEIPKLVNTVYKAIIKLINGLADTINANTGPLSAAGVNLGLAIINGMTLGMAGQAYKVYNKAKEIAETALSYITKPWKAFSPSKTMIELGGYIVSGLALGMDKNAVDAYSSAIAMSNGVINAFNTTFQTASPSKVMIQIGQYVGQGFAQGLRGSKDDIVGAFAELNDKLTEAITTAKETIISEQEKLDKLRESKKPDTAAIKKAQDIINQNEALLRKSTETRNILVNSLKDEKKELIGLTKEYENIGNKLKLAQDALAQAQQTRSDAVKSFTDQYSTLPDIIKTDSDGNPVDQVALYQEALVNQTNAVAAYQATLQQLRKLGLDDATYQKLLTEGPADQAFASQLLAGGKTAVEGLNKLDKNLQITSQRLATNAAKNLYDAGVDAAAGLVKGLQSKHDDIRREMEEIAREMIRALRKELNSKSPSKEFEKIGTDAMLGLANGFAKSTQVVTTSVVNAGKEAISAMKESMRKITDAVGNELNPSLVITPVLDLTTIRTQAGELAALTAVTPITAAASFGQASIISSTQNASQDESVTPVPGAASVKFEQNNYSPTALSEIEIYRQTRNQLSQLKTVLAIT